MKRFVTFLAFGFGLVLAGCKDVPGGATSTTSSFVRPGTDVVIKSVRTYAPNDSIAGTNDEYYIVNFTWTNNVGFALTPRIDHFVIENNDKTRYLGAETGNAAIVGISNYPQQLKPGDSHDYTVGFRVPVNTYGTLFYDPTF